MTGGTLHYDPADFGPLDDGQKEALATAGAIAAQMLELGPGDLDRVRQLVPATAIALALLFVESDAEYSPRWIAAGEDWMARAQVLHDALLFVLTPERAAERRPVDAAGDWTRGPAELWSEAELREAYGR